MMRAFLAFIALLAFVAVSAPARAADPKAEAEAQALQKKAIEEDYLNVDYAGAIKKLQSAVTKCGADNCKPAVKAALLRDLGAMQILAGSQDDGKASFGQALVIDSSIELDPAYKNPQLDGIWSEVKKATSAAAPKTGEGQQPPASVGDFVHTPPTEVAVRTPIALYVEYPVGEAIAHVIAKYKGYAMSDWKAVELKKMDKGGYGGFIPCADVVQGPMQYYLQGFNGRNESVATAGSRTRPLTITIKPQVAGPAPSLPGQGPPAQCPDTSAAECPPDFPGCKKTKKPVGDTCSKPTDCESGLCSDGTCEEKKGAGETCANDSECSSGTCSDSKCTGKKADNEACEGDEECESGRCETGKCGATKKGRGPRRLWLGVSVQGDWYFMPSARNVCVVSPSTLTLNTAGYFCVDPNSGENFPTGPDFSTGGGYNSRITSRFDEVVGGPAFGNVRILATADYAVTPNVLVGARVGYTLFTTPATGTPSSAFAPVHIEARVSYVFGRKALFESTVAPMVLFGLGLGEFDAFVPVTVEALLPNAMGQPVATSATENAWLTAGPFFVAAGGGARILLAPEIAATAALKLEAAFGGSAGALPGLAPEVGVQFGL
jgi:hypothetical protein